MKDQDTNKKGILIGFIQGLIVTIRSSLRRPVTAEYPSPDKRLDLADRYMGFPALMWDFEVNEPYCTGCMVCIRECPTQCMSATMKDNPLYAESRSRRRKIVDEFQINLGRCILCGICVDVCNFDAIEMSHEHELSRYERNGNRVDLRPRLSLGREYQQKVLWEPTQPEKNRGTPVGEESSASKDTLEGHLLPKALSDKQTGDKQLGIDLKNKREQSSE